MQTGEDPMADQSITPPEPDASVKVLKETLQAQQELLQQLYTELDVEREAAASATSESLSMMLKLQGEKAAVEMEASQYKRIAEEKMVHAEETLDIFRDLIYQKEMQIASLEFQVQAYKFKLISMGCNDVGEGENHFPENMFFRRNGLPGGEQGIQKKMRRGSSLPPNFLNDFPDPSNNVEVSGETSLKVLPTLPMMKDFDLGHAKSGDFSCYWEQIKKLDERVKELSVSKDFSASDNKLNEMNQSLQSEDSVSKDFFASDNKLNEMNRSLQSEDSGSFYDALRGSTPRIDVVEPPERLLDVEPSKDSTAPSQVQDIFEVPRIPKLSRFANSPKAEQEELSLEPEIQLERPDPIKTVISGIPEKFNFDQRTPISSPFVDTIIPKPRDGPSVEPFSFKRPDVTDFELQQMNRRLRRLEDQRIMVRQDTPRMGLPRPEIVDENDDDKVVLLKSIKDQLNIIENEIMSWRPQNPSPEEQLDLTPLTEAMLHFWL